MDDDWNNDGLDTVLACLMPLPLPLVACLRSALCESKWDSGD
jgi:hypothetical protein